MNSEIRASHVLASVGSSSGSTDLSLQNPLFSLGSDSAFPQVLKEQVSARREPARGPDVSEAQRERRAASARQDEQARDRQAGGKDLPASADRVNDVRERARPTADRADNADSAPREAEAAADNVEKPSATEAESVSEPAVANQQDAGAETDESVVDEAAVLAAAVVPVDQLVQQDVSVDATREVVETTIEEPMALPAQPVAGGELQVEAEPVVVQTEGNRVDEVTMAVSTGQQSATTETDPLEQPAAEAVVAMLKPTEGSPAAVASAATVADAAAEVRSATAVSSSVAQVEQPVTAATAQVDTASTERARLPADALAGLRQFGDGESAEKPGSQPAETGELGPEVSRAEKNAEARAELSRQQLAAGGERQQGIRDQLAALVQQVTGAADQTQKQADKRKPDAVSDVKPTVFSRTLEQFSAARTETGKPVSTGIQTPVGQREWAGELGQRLVMMVSSKLKSAEIHLNPKELGPVEVRIRMHEDKAHVVFSSQVAQTRDALEQAVPRLREMLDQNGVALGNVDVRDQGAQHSHAQDQLGRNQRGQGGGGEGADADVDATPVPVRMVGLVDYYA